MPPTSQQHNPDIAVERSDAPPRLFAFLAAGLAGFLVISLVALQLIYPGSLAGPSDAPGKPTAKPALQIEPDADLAALRSTSTKKLASYGWVDRAHGVVRIPIDEAMQDVAATGIPDWPKDVK